MSKEIERKFLVNKELWDKHNKTEGIILRQGFLVNKIGKVVRIRIISNKAFLTIKGPTINISRNEFEYEIPVSDAESLLSQFCENEITKIRFNPVIGGMKWDVDEFLNENEGLLMAEIELESEDQEFEKPEWLGKEVSDDFRYYNAYLIDNPYKFWEKS